MLEHVLRGAVGCCVGLLLVSLLLAQSGLINYQVIQHVRVEGEFQHIKKSFIQEKVSPLLNKGYFFADLLAIQRAIKQLAWVDRVIVQRIWPDKISIRIYEQKPIARWQGQYLLNGRAEVFYPENKEDFQLLPNLNVPLGEQKRFLKIMQESSSALKLHNLKVVEFIVTPRQSWKVILDNGLHIQLGRHNPQKRFLQLIETLSLLGQKRLMKAARIDMRYPNGYTIAWREDVKKE